MSRLIVKRNEFWIDGEKNPVPCEKIEIDCRPGNFAIAKLHCVFDEIEIDDCEIVNGLDLQEKLIQAQIDYMNARADAIEESETEINISCDGLDPILEQTLQEIMQKYWFLKPHVGRQHVFNREQMKKLWRGRVF